jgi:hypothetical protein
MADTVLTIYKTKPLFLHHSTFMSDLSFFAGLHCQSLQQTFSLWQSLVLSLVTKVAPSDLNLFPNLDPAFKTQLFSS